MWDEERWTRWDGHQSIDNPEHASDTVSLIKVRFYKVKIRVITNDIVKPKLDSVEYTLLSPESKYALLTSFVLKKITNILANNKTSEKVIAERFELTRGVKISINQSLIQSV